MKGFITAAGVALALLAAQPAAATHDQDGPVNTVDAATAFNNDAALIAHKTGWSLDDTRNHMRFQDALSNLLPKISTKYANTYAGAEMAPKPGEPAVIRFKGQAPPGIAEDIAASGLKIDIQGGSKYTQKEIRDRSTAIARYLASVGYRDVVTAVMPTGFVEVTIGGSTAPKPLLPQALRDDTRITVIDGPANREEDARGGAWLQDNDANMCTSGFAVTTLGGTTGVSTAAHCSGLDQYNPPNGDPDFSITFQGQHLGIFGDVQWQTTVDPTGRVLARDTEIRRPGLGRAVERHLRQQLVLHLRPLVQQPPVRRGVLRLRQCHLGRVVHLVARRHDRRQHDRRRQRRAVVVRHRGRRRPSRRSVDLVPVPQRVQRRGPVPRRARRVRADLVKRW